eukprot:s3347_g11.t1
MVRAKVLFFLCVETVCISSSRWPQVSFDPMTMSLQFFNAHCDVAEPECEPECAEPAQSQMVKLPRGCSAYPVLGARYVFAIVFTDVSNEYASGFEDVSEESLVFLQKYFFDLERSVFTLFESICNGLNWGEIADKLNTLSRIWGYLYVIFVAFCLFAVLNVEMFMSIFHMLQQDRGRRASGNITFMEFEQLFDREQIRTFFQALDVEAKDAWTLFKLMDVSGLGNRNRNRRETVEKPCCGQEKRGLLELLLCSSVVSRIALELPETLKKLGNGDLDASEFVDGCMRLKGPARSIDVSLLLQEQRRMRKKIVSIEQILADFRRDTERLRSKRPSSNSKVETFEKCAL